MCARTETNVFKLGRGFGSLCSYMILDFGRYYRHHFRVHMRLFHVHYLRMGRRAEYASACLWGDVFAF